MNKVSHIYPIDDISIHWCIVNELVGKKFKDRFIISNWKETDTIINVTILTCSGEELFVNVPKERLLKLTRSVKLKGLADEKDTFSMEQKKILNEKRLESLKFTCLRNQQRKITDEREKYANDRKHESRKEIAGRKYKSYYSEYYGHWVTKRLKGNCKITRKRLAKENKGCGKSKNR